MACVKQEVRLAGAAAMCPGLGQRAGPRGAGTGPGAGRNLRDLPSQPRDSTFPTKSQYFSSNPTAPPRMPYYLAHYLVFKSCQQLQAHVAIFGFSGCGQSLTKMDGNLRTFLHLYHHIICE